MTGEGRKALPFFLRAYLRMFCRRTRGRFAGTCANANALTISSFNVAGRDEDGGASRHIDLRDDRPIAADQAAFVADGSHRGSLSADLSTIDAEWTTGALGTAWASAAAGGAGDTCAPMSTS